MNRAERKELNKDIKTEKARVTTARQERKTSKTTDRLAKVKKKVDLSNVDWAEIPESLHFILKEKKNDKT